MSGCMTQRVQLCSNQLSSVIYFIQLCWVYLSIQVDLYNWQGIFHSRCPPPDSSHLLLIFRVYIICQSGFLNDLHLTWFPESGQKLGRFERDKLDFSIGVLCEDPVMPSGTQRAADLWCAVAALLFVCLLLPGAGFVWHFIVFVLLLPPVCVDQRIKRWIEFDVTRLVVTSHLIS